MSYFSRRFTQQKLFPRLTMVSFKRSQFVLFLFGLFCVGKVYGQTSTQSRTDVYSFLVEQFRTLPVTNKDIVFVGNSITFWGNWLEMTGNRHIKNRGIPGEHTYGLLERLDYILKGKPRKIFIMIGINDLGKGLPDSVILKNWHDIISKVIIQTPKTKVYVHSILPTNPSFGRLKHLYGHESHIRYINTELEKITKQYPNFIFVDLASEMADKRGFLRNEYTWDGVHLTVEGYNKWLKTLLFHKYL